MRADQVSRGLFHGSLFERLMNVPQVGSLEGRPFCPVQDPVLVEFSLGGISGMEPVGDRCSGAHGDIVGEPGIQPSDPLPRGPLPLDPKTGDLTERMHAGIRAAGPDHRYGFLGQVVQRGLDGLLNAGLIRLALPPGVARTVVFELQPHGRHGVGSQIGGRIIAPIVWRRPRRRSRPRAVIRQHA